MVHQFLDGSYRQTNLPNESPEYLARREELRLAEIELMQHQERVAAMRRALPPGPVLPDYEFLEVSPSLDVGGEPIKTVKLSDLFTAPGRPLVIYHMMYGKKQNRPCPMCTLWVDGFNGVAHHLARNMDFAIVMAAEPDAIREFALTRGWNNLLLLSAGAGAFKFDLGSENADGAQDSAISVFEKDDTGTVRHSYTTHPRMSPEIKERGIDLLSPVWHLLDLTTQGRGNWYPSLVYGAKVGS